MPTLAISTVPLNVVSSKTLLAFRGTGALNTGSSLTVVDWQTTVGVFFQDLDISKNIFHFPASPCNKRHAQCVPSDVGNGQSKFGGDMMRRSRDIRVRAEASAIGRKSRRRRRSQEDDHSRMNSACASQIRLRSDPPFLRNAPTDRQTDRQTPLLYIYRFFSMH